MYNNPDSNAWHDILLVTRLFSCDPSGFGGIRLKSRPGPVQDKWLEYLRYLIEPGRRLVRIPIGISEDRLFGGLDLAGTLRQGQAIFDTGLLASAKNDVLLIPMAERIPEKVATQLGNVMDQEGFTRNVCGQTETVPSKFGLVAIDESYTEDESPPQVLLDRLAFTIDLRQLSHRDLPEAGQGDHGKCVDDLCYLDVEADPEYVEAICETAMALGIPSLRAPCYALRAAKAIAALEGVAELSLEHVVKACSLVLAPRARYFPEQNERGENNEHKPEPEESRDDTERDTEPGPVPEDLNNIILQATRAVLPENLLSHLENRSGLNPAGSDTVHRRGTKNSMKQGRPIGHRRGEPDGRRKLDIFATIQSAAPWQKIRTSPPSHRRVKQGLSDPIKFTRDDFRVKRMKSQSPSTTIFVVDASGSTALHRLSEAKGAVELLLADCYIRRDQVALITFRGEGAEVSLPPTRAIARAQRSLSGLAGGGGTPLAAGIETAMKLAQSERKKGMVPILVFLTDGGANVDIEGRGNRTKAKEEAEACARALRVTGLSTLLIDTSPRPKPVARELADVMGAEYLPLPMADAKSVSRSVKQMTAQTIRQS